MPPHPLTNFEIQNYYQNEPRLSGVNNSLITVYNHKYKMTSYCLKCKKDTENINPNFKLYQW